MTPLEENASTTTTAAARPPLLHRLAGVARRNPFRTVYAAGLLIGIGYQLTKPEEEKKKKVLVLPFYRMRIVESKKKDLKGLLTTQVKSGSNKVIELEVDELVDLIHQAAQDPDIVALYGIFGHGFGFATGGWGHVEEIRNALQVFRESHRVHKDPNLHHDPILRNGHSPRKPLYAYADTFANPVGMGTPEYYLASAFTHVQMQPQGDLNLFGLHTTNTFMKDALDKYGVKVHVFKHGMYKNFANQFTDRKYTKEHKENVQNILLEINRHVCQGIYNRRPNLSGFEFSNFWHMVHKAGSFPAVIAQQVGFIDYLPRLDPLEQLVESNKSEELKTTMKEKWGKETDMDHFLAESAIAIDAYGQQVSKQKRKEEKQWKIFKAMKDYSQHGPFVRILLSSLGYSAPYFNIPESTFSEKKAMGLDEKIAVIKLGGAITDATARKTERALRKLKSEKNVNCVVIRVDSPGGAITACETIFREIEDLPQKVIVSFGNVSASGGYYISSGAERIFASPTTVTGSIGVFMIRVDLRDLAAQYGIKFDSVATSELSGSFDPFYPVNTRMKDNFRNFADRSYHHFKTLVSTGRNMDMDVVESVAQGRVWTGEQAKELGLVDELGGLHRAIAYAQRNYTNSGHATVVSWPPEPTLREVLEKGTDADLEDLQMTSLWHFLFKASEKMGIGKSLKSTDCTIGGSTFPLTMSGMMLTVDENSAIQCLLQNNSVPDLLNDFHYPPSFWE